MATFSIINNGDTGLVSRTAINNIVNYINSPGVQTLTDASTITWNYPSGYNARVVINGNRSLSITGATAGDYGTLIITQGATGSYRINFGANDKFAGGTYSFSTTGTQSDIYTFLYDGTNYYWNYNKNFS